MLIKSNLKLVQLQKTHINLNVIMQMQNENTHPRTLFIALGPHS